MRTTLDLPETLFRQVKAKAAMEGTTLKDLVTNYVVLGLQQSPPSVSAARHRSRLPVIKKRGRRSIPNLTPELQARIQEEEDLARLNRPSGR